MHRECSNLSPFDGWFRSLLGNIKTLIFARWPVTAPPQKASTPSGSYFPIEPVSSVATVQNASFRIVVRGSDAFDTCWQTENTTLNKRLRVPFHALFMHMLTGDRGGVPIPSDSLIRAFVIMNLNWTTDHREWYRNVYLHSEHWSDLKARKLSANPECQRCGSKFRLDIHHVNYRNIFDVELSDLLTLCRGYHDKEHEENGMPIRPKVDYGNYIPEPAKKAIEAQNVIRKVQIEAHIAEQNRVWNKKDWKAYHKRKNKNWKKTTPESWAKTKLK